MSNMNFSDDDMEGIDIAENLIRYVCSYIQNPILIFNSLGVEHEHDWSVEYTDDDMQKPKILPHISNTQFEKLRLFIFEVCGIDQNHPTNYGLGYARFFDATFLIELRINSTRKLEILVNSL